ncbi:hypothetical protein FJ661_04990 [Pseudarthrobacter phenanthrenivorans]|uniref:hypothetical protein n=1 Tax=Pseudarthrobacter phenanthrenivorans TaxID=361575 RepID=UPI0011262554|nr:hypothetical protein [Pseudarthrobacter phenanthrenivorans]TPV52649.1 hypothetical protein FJ661_04990 [Pseudarthrobacter phenanthrenivorans]
MKAHPEGTALKRTAGGSPALAAAVAAGLGGLSLTASGILQSMQPPGCIAAECVGRTYRSAGPLESFLFLAGVLLIAGATLGFLVLLPARMRVVRIAAATAAACMFFGVALMGSALYFAGVALVLVAVAAYIVMGVGLAVSRTLPAWAGVVLAVSSLLLLGANDQNERILFVVPFGLAWLALGTLLWSAEPAVTPRGHSSVKPI